jgi:cell division protein FtsN
MPIRSHTSPYAARKRATAAAPRRTGAGGTLLGVFIGLVLGLGLAAAVAFYVMKSGNPYQTTPPSREPAKEMAKSGKTDSAASDKSRFDFYKILPGADEPKVQAKAPERATQDKATVERAAAPPDKADKAAPKQEARAAPEAPVRTAKAADRFWLQTGSFAAEGDAEDLKARLAMAGWEAVVQSAAVPDKGTRYRVRLGPFDNTDELNRIKGELGKRGFDAAVIKY